MSDKKRTLREYFSSVATSSGNGTLKKKKINDDTKADIINHDHDKLEKELMDRKINNNDENGKLMNDCGDAETNSGSESLHSSLLSVFSELNITDEDEDDEQNISPNSVSNVPLQISKPVGPNDLAVSLEDGPVQPKLKVFGQKKYGNRWRSFKSHWFERFTWLEYSALEDSAYCFPCRFFSSQRFEKNVSFISLGYNNWKRAMETDSGFRKHLISEQHKKSEVMWTEFKLKKDKNISVINQLCDANLKQIEEDRKYLGIIIECLLFISIQGISFRGHNETEHSSNKGNFLELINFLANNNSVPNNFLKLRLQNAHKNAKYLHPTVQNEILKTISDLIVKEIYVEVNKCDFYAIMVDETKDISKNEQISIVIRYYYQGTIYERFLGFKCAEALNARTLFAHIKSTLKECNIDINKCIAQTYDGASVMSGKSSGVQSLFQQEVPQAIYIHCFNHKLNLVLVDACKHVKETDEFFAILEKLYVFCSGSNIHIKFIKLQKQICPDRKPIELKRVCFTRRSFFLGIGI
ncbi:zinc finger MYM-type protein 1-like [Sitophilus oryzae]|uniref:Zinc finger MYM-type protein 1-like n=1 Tax=Sitophilus oryzae TaxID=7048 RepID=A0A6J2YWG5_SITOR|nr:zinc finger MYM-type protein 1-like [Sitophilus oryzae]